MSSLVSTDTSLEPFQTLANKWLTWQCQMISEVKIGAVFLESSTHTDSIEMLAVWSQEAWSEMSDKLYQLALDVVEGKQGRVSKLTCSINSNDMVCDSITLPLRRDNKIIGAVIFLMPVRSEDQKKAVLQLFQWGMTWLESSLESASESLVDIQPFMYSLIKLSLVDEPIALTSYNICNMLVEHFHCTRVALGKVNGLNVEILGMSNQFRFDARSGHLRGIELAMEESSDQKKSIVYPKSSEILSLITQKHHTLSTLNDNASILTVPLIEEDVVVGVILLMRSKNRPFQNDECKRIESVLELVAASFSLKLKQEKTLGKKFILASKVKLHALFGKANLKLKMLSTGVLVLVSLLYFLKTSYFIYAKSSLEGTIEQVIVAPYDGFIETSSKRAGNEVSKDAVLVSLNDNDLQIEYRKLISKREKIKKEYGEALALRKRSKISILSAQISQVDAQIELVEEKRHRGTIKAPFSGIVVSGDLSQSLGAPVEKGEVLFTLSPLGTYRVILNVGDEDISKLHIGDKGSLRLVGLPYDALHILISRIIPISSVSDGGNYFHVEATFDDMNNSRLKPGMQGIAKVRVGEESILWVVSHTLVDRIRLWFWSLGL